MMVEMPCIALAAGGTPGHIVPALALADEMAARGWEAVFVGTRRGSGAAILRGTPYEHAIIPGEPYQREGLGGRLRALGELAPSAIAARKLLRDRDVDAVVGFGGYASIGPLLAARSLGIPTALLEPNAVPGLANRYLGRFVDRIYLGATSFCPAPLARKALRTGIPIRREVLEARTEIAPTPGRHRIVVLGDTNGTRFMSEQVPLLLNALKTPVEVVHQGEPPVAYAATIPVRRAAFLGGREIYEHCDLLISRAGAGTLAEIAALGIPALVVPLAEAAEDHQTGNARIFAERRAALVAPQHGWKVDELAPAVDALLTDRGARDAMRARSRSLAAPDAARRIADDLAMRLGASRT
jgi:UDP-N-acetylglucosamine--N-acetylmuramyl-(pentapeptide) pyrophosphoryl-undecaprenol N-acetylglucosamine transferase